MISKEKQLKLNELYESANKLAFGFICDLDTYGEQIVKDLTKRLREHGIIWSREKVSSISILDTMPFGSTIVKARLYVGVLDSMYRKTVYYCGRWEETEKRYVKMTDKVFEIVVDCLEYHFERVSNIMEQNKKKPDIETYADKIEELANKHLVDGYSAKFEHGSYNMAPEIKLNALIFRYNDNDYVGSITFGTDPWGDYALTQKVPLAGECSRSFKIENLENEIIKVLDFMRILDKKTCLV